MASEKADRDGVNSSSYDAVTRGDLVRNSILAGSTAGMAINDSMLSYGCSQGEDASSALVSNNSGVIGTAREVLQSGGIRALYTGLAVPLAAQAVYKSTVFTVNNLTEQLIKEWKDGENHKRGIPEPYALTSFDHFISGCTGGAVNAA
eukprot:CAMPEP_0176013012 /NCGR_PEP_ID=MMETSP0120_2-20121206/6090_1 /TAXON_ID=160619 /ORGANISM="Kryptoperidinium foliaceum, Strain CCMP 1326" /LENGTH=147 /DNA_ID=CAMNT_0017345913 /DNA_START=180 /DNA_END=620 /DNA_ORIENTATION=-